MSPDGWSAERARAITEETCRLAGRGALLPVLHALQGEFGYVSPEAVGIAADVLNLSVAEVHGVVSFYRDFRTEPPGRRIVRVCRAEACQSMGAEALMAHAKQSLGVAEGGTTADGKVTLRQVFCLGNCGLSPAVMIDDRVYGRVGRDRFDQLMALEAGEASP